MNTQATPPASLPRSTDRQTVEGLRAEVEQTGLARGVQVGVAAPSLVAAWLDGRNERTRRAYAQDLDSFRQFIGVATIDGAAEVVLGRGHGAANGTALAYRAYLKERGLSAATINRRLASLRSLVHLARTLGIVPWTLEVQNLKAEAYRDTRGPGRAGFRSLLQALAQRTDPKARRDLALLRLLHDLGLRRAEVVGLDLEHLDLAGSRLSVLRKGKTDRLWLTLPAPTLAALKDWLSVRGDGPGQLFAGFRGGKGKRLSGGGLYRVVRNLGRMVGVQVRPHGLRHTAITEAVKAAQANGMGLEEVLDFSGHADVRTLMVYRDRERNVQGRLAALVAEGT
jgi:integrase/recombinase XerC